MTRQETIQQKTTQQEPIRQELPQPNGEAPRAASRQALHLAPRCDRSGKHAARHSGAILKQQFTTRLELKSSAGVRPLGGRAFKSKRPRRSMRRGLHAWSFIRGHPHTGFTSRQPAPRA